MARRKLTDYERSQRKAKKTLARNFFMEALRREVRKGKYDDYEKVLVDNLLI